MRNIKIIEKEVRAYKIVGTLTCDICGANSRNGENWECGYGRREITIRDYDIESYPEDTFGKYVFYDLCPNCFTTILIPFLREKTKKEPQEIDCDDWVY